MKNRLLKWMPLLFIIFTAFTSTIWAKEISKGTVNEQTTAYTSPSADAQSTCYVNKGEELPIVEETNGYYGVYIENNEVVYIEKEYIDVPDEEEQPQEAEEKPVVKQLVKDVSKGEAVVEYAKQFIGLPYRSGGNSLRTGVDCSGFSQQIYAHFNVSLQRSSRSQYASNGISISRSELQPGDLVFYGSGSVNHVAIYVGDNKIIHAPVPGQSVCIAPMFERGWDPIIGYKRIF